MSWANCPLQGLSGQGSGSQYYFEASRDIRVWDTLPSGLSFVSSFRIIENHQWVYSTPTFLLGNAQWGCRINPSSSMRQWFEFWYNGSFVTDLAIDASLSSIEWSEISLICGVDESNQKATIFLLHRYPNQYNPDSIYYIGMYDGSQRFTNNNYCYQWIQGHIAPQYTWQSVPSISGKNGILQSLVQIKEEAINDGEPVSEATVLSFDSLGNINIPSVIDEQMPVDPSDVTSVTATYLIPALENGTYEGIKLLVKKGSIPTSEEDADKVVDIDEPTSILRIGSKAVGNLDEDSHYYFVVKVVDEIGTEATSDPKDIWTSHSEGWTFDYTGEIQEFTAPKTGIYSLETWGAQGGNATDGTNSARGGYGAYAYGEVLLTQGEKLYINVGGQNGYGGGGNGSVTYDVKNIAKTLDYEHIKSGSDIASLSSYYLTDWWLYFGQISQNRPFRYEDSTFYCLSEDASTAQNVQVHTLVPIPRLSNVVNIKFKIRRTQVRSGTEWNQLYLNFAHIGDNNSFSRDYIINVNSPVQEGNLIVTTPNLNEWYEFETGEINISYVDYVEFVRTYAGYDIKDIEITCST